MNSLKLLLFGIGMVAVTTVAAQVEFVGDYSIDLNQGVGEVAVEIEQLRNASSTRSTGPLFLALRYTQCDAATSYGVYSFEPDEDAGDDARPGYYALDRVVPGGDSRLAAQASWTDIRFTTNYLAPPSGTHRRHFVVYELDASEAAPGVLEPIGAARFPYLHQQSGHDDFDSCFTARPLDAHNGRHRDYLSLGDRGDYYRIESFLRGTLQVDFDGNLAAFGELLDSDGRPLANAAGEEETENFRIERHIDDRVYYLRIAKSSRDDGYYNLHTQVVPGTGAEATDRDDDTAQLATPLRMGVAVNDAIDTPGDVDWWTFRTRSSGSLVMETSGGTDTQGSLYDGFVQELATDDDSGEDDNFRIGDATVFAAGTYHVRVAGGRNIDTGPYTLRVSHFADGATGQPDLVVEFPDEDALTLLPGEGKLLAARVRNRGNGASVLTAVRLLQSANPLISDADTRVDSVLVDPLEAQTSSLHFVGFDGFAQPGAYFIGGCVRPVDNESNADNNCSAALPVVVGDSTDDGATVARRYSVPLLPASADSRGGFVRLVNRSNRAGRIEMQAVDDMGLRHGPYELALGARAAVQFTSNDLESGNPDLGIATGTGSPQGDWRLELTTNLDIAALAYARAPDGFLTSAHETAVSLEDGRHYVPFFNPAGNTRQRSLLRLVNPGADDVAVTITGIDDRGESPPDGEVSLNVPAGAARVISARDLESGGAALRGHFGSGAGKWRLFVASSAPVEVLSLLEAPTGNLANLSAPGRKQSLPLVLPGADAEVGRDSFIRIINATDAPGDVHIQAVDDAGQETPSITLSLAALSAVQINSKDLESGNERKGLVGGIGPAEGDRRLELRSDLDIEALAYVRTADGFVASIHGSAMDVQGAAEVPFFNSGGIVDPQSRLRLINRGATDAPVMLTGWDDFGRRPPYGTTRLTVPAGESRTITAHELEVGAAGLRGRFGAGVGKWRLAIAAEQPIQVMSLLQSPTGNLANLSGSGGESRETAGEGSD